jgi:hypothetical protein
MPKTEAFSCVLIDEALKDSDWDLLDKHRVRYELNGTSGHADYVLCGDRGYAKTPMPPSSFCPTAKITYFGIASAPISAPGKYAKLIEPERI